ncbi:right-handed parallel beta-helix repeat-containing protein [Sphingomonas sp. AX6]|uniref:right-handed parallel beta-helix repeat-containing protein n=1 Tax=Sphingomonas sp. AX6 TaxID=2653171 RepID=UPI0012F3593D|nr:right-handed parallel beta-helix repeat-containing protein [Sphingomonas sp. AX6]VXC47360.1 conserved exported hypothetical protein [Sphingomonas sp. AX6]
MRDGLTRRCFVASMFATAPLAAAACRAAPGGQEEDSVALPDFRRAGDSDDSAALARAFATGRPVHAPAGRGSGPGGRYLIGNTATATLPSGATLFGDGVGRTVIARSGASNPFILHGDSGSPDPGRNIRGLTFRDLSFVDDVERLGFSEFSYLVMLNGVSDVRFERVAFRGFRGDGLHLGSSVTSQVERHNRNVVIENCVFDGINANNRNAVSVIDVDGLRIERSRFLNVTRAGDGTAVPGDPMNPATGIAQPGAIDLEPNADAFAVIRNIVIRDNDFAGGGGAAISLLLLPNDVVRTPQQGILIENNRIRDRVAAFQAFGFVGDGAVRSDRPYAITFRNNQVTGCDKPFIVSGIRGMRMAGNLFRDCASHAEMGYRGTNVDIALSGNRFERVGAAPPGMAMWVRDADGIEIADNHFVDAGAAGDRSGVAIAFVSGVVKGLTMRGNRFRSGDGRMSQSVMLFKDARVEARSLRLERNEAVGNPLAQILSTR